MPLVESYYLYRFDSETIDGVDRVDMGQIRFMLKGKGRRTFPDGHVEPSHPVMINPPGTGAAAYHVDGPFHCFGVSLRAIGWKSLIGLPANKVTNRLLDGAELFGTQALDLLERLRAMATIEEMIAAVEPFLLARRRRVPEAHLALARAVREWAAAGASGGAGGVEALYAMVDMSERQVMRVCNEYFGGPPKMLERKFRAIRAAMRIYQGGDPADAAEPFADQSHMINEVRRFTGHTPTSLRAGIDPVLALTLDSETFHFLPDVIPESVDPGGK
ncbi:AraC family transcriptional regulator [Sphingomonas sp. LB-2]|nr:AraC family transcriptional regulator [Sphingomonas caeni]